MGQWLLWWLERIVFKENFGGLMNDNEILKALFQEKPILLLNISVILEL
jgi:hypothetical protein